MRPVAITALCVALAACHHTVWTSVAPRDVGDHGEAFVLIGGSALHLRHVEQIDGHLHAQIVHAWALPPVGAAQLAETADISPEDIARGAGWRELPVANAPLDVPVAAVRSARARVGVEPDPDFETEHPVLATVMVTTLDALLAPR
jgi:hypothetical protein